MVDALRSQAAILFAVHSGLRRLGVLIAIEVMQAHVSVRMYLLMGMGLKAPRCEDGQGLGGYADRGDISRLWAVAPDCVDRCLEHWPMIRTYPILLRRQQNCCQCIKLKSRTTHR